MSAAYGWAVTGLVPGREFRVTRVDVHDGGAEVHYALRPGIAQGDAEEWRALLPALSLSPAPPGEGHRVQGGFVPDDAETVGDLGIYHPAIRAGEPCTLVLRSVTHPDVVLTLEVGPAPG